MKRDNIIFDIIEKEHQRQLKGIELIASENFVSDQVMQAMGSCLTNKYAEGYPDKATHRSYENNHHVILYAILYGPAVHPTATYPYKLYYRVRSYDCI